MMDVKAEAFDKLARLVNKCGHREEHGVPMMVDVSPAADGVRIDLVFRDEVDGRPYGGHVDLLAAIQAIKEDG
ncbi:MAG: hypothetical protein MUP73_04565 [Dehalococcoidia bacterium]|nr:hypothetical protein [Dehalococcoidia bacterium]